MILILNGGSVDCQTVGCAITLGIECSVPACMQHGKATLEPFLVLNETFYMYCSQWLYDERAKCCCRNKNPTPLTVQKQKTNDTDHPQPSNLLCGN